MLFAQSKQLDPSVLDSLQRSLCAIYADHEQELEFLTESAVISPQQLSSILSQLPAQTQVHTPIHSPLPSTIQQLSNLNLSSEKNQFTPSPIPAPPPPAYASGLQVLSLASALYAYTPTDAGDLALQQHDRVQVTEHMNNDCMSISCAGSFVNVANNILPQGGEGEMNEQALRVSFRGAMSILSRRSVLRGFRHTLAIMATCL